MDVQKAKEYIKNNGRPIEKAMYELFFENGDRNNVVEALKAFQNPDGGFGHGLEADNWDENSTPIATNDAIIYLHRAGVLEKGSDMVNDIVRYLDSRDNFDFDKNRWRFAVETTKNYPHAIWWEKTDDGVRGFNPTVSLAAFMVCFAPDRKPYEEMVRRAFEQLDNGEDFIGDDLKSYMLCYELFENNGISDVVDMDAFFERLCEKMKTVICPDTSKYGKEYVTLPSDIVPVYRRFDIPWLSELKNAEIAILGDMQREDGGFNISWQWYTDYPTEFEQAKIWWSARLTLDKLLFAAKDPIQGVISMLIIREMTIEDYDSVYDLWINTPGMGLNETDDSREGIERYLRRNPTTCFVAEEEGKTVGVIMAGHDGRRGYIHHTAVLPEYRNRGIARSLVEHAMDALDKEGINKVALVAFSHNGDGNAFWEKVGFTARGDLVYRNKNIHDLVRIDT